ncbi:MAG: iron-sulfur cluster assembly accessory protein [Sulfuricella sp.]|nr:iron-sulfur cluster assembly accessory protein [Sulfuricella sp.]
MKLAISLPAENFIRRMIRFNGAAGSGFRLVVTPGGCSGMSYEFSVEKAPLPGDVVVMHNDLSLFVSAESVPLLDGATIGFEDSPTQTRLVFVNPNLAQSCSGACSSSAAAANVVSLVRTPA